MSQVSRICLVPGIEAGQLLHGDSAIISPTIIPQTNNDFQQITSIFTPLARYSSNNQGFFWNDSWWRYSQIPIWITSRCRRRRSTRMWGPLHPTSSRRAPHRDAMRCVLEQPVYDHDELRFDIIIFVLCQTTWVHVRSIISASYTHNARLYARITHTNTCGQIWVAQLSGWGCGCTPQTSHALIHT